MPVLRAALDPLLAVMSSPRKRSSLVGTGKTSSFGPGSAASPMLNASGTGFAGKALRKNKAWPYAPRSARYRLREILLATEMTPQVFAQAVSNGSDTAINQNQLLDMEAGWALVPAWLMANAEKVHAEHQAELEKLRAAQPQMLVGGQFPYQEPMEGQDFQIAPSRYLGAVGSQKAMSREARKDALVFNHHKLAASKVDDYLEQVRVNLERTGGVLRFSEEVALSILHDLRYNTEASLAALRHCVAWTYTPEPGDISTKAPGRAAAANSVLWLMRLREHARHNTFSDGEKEALHAGIAKHGKELATLFRSQQFLQEKTLPQLIEMYYVAGARHQSP